MRFASRRDSVAGFHDCRHFRGFSLTELLVVMGIIAILIATLLPAVSKARRSMADLQCQTNLRSLAQAVFAYANDWKGVMPRANSEYPKATPIIQDWLKTIEPYLRPTTDPLTSYKTEPLYICPRYMADNVITNVTNYGMNWLIDLQAYNESLPTPLPDTPSNYRITQIKRNADIFLFGDKSSSYSANSYNPTIKTGDNTTLPDLRHGSGVNSGVATGVANIVYCDGHVGTVDKTQRTILKSYDFKQ